MQKRKYKRILTMVLCIFFLTGLLEPVAVYGTETKEAPKEKIRIGYIDYERFISLNEDGSYSGYGVDFLKAISKYTDWEYEYVYDSWENQLENLKNGDIDFICHAQKTKEREETYIFSKYSIGAESNVLYARKDDDRYYYNDFSYFDGMKVALLRDSFQNQEFENFAAKKGFSYIATEYETQQKCFDALETGEVDAVAAGSLALNTQYKVISRFGSDPFYFMSGKQNTELMEELDDALGQITAAGSSFEAEEYQKYYGSGSEKGDVTFTREEVEYIADAGTITIAFIPNRKPFSYVSDTGEIEGITVDIMDLIAERSGLKFSYVMMPLGKRVTEYFEEYPETLVAGVMAANPEFQNNEYLLSDCFYTDDVALASLRGTDYDLSAEDATYRLAIPRSYAALDLHIKKNYPQFEVIYCRNMEECLDMVQEQTADFTAQNVNVIKLYLQNPHYENIAVLPTFFMDEDMGVVAKNTKENRLLLGILDKCIGSITDKEISQFTVDRTVANGYRLTWRDMLYKFRYPLLIVAVLLAAVIGMMAAFIILRKRNYRRLEEKNGQLAEAVAQANGANRAKSMFLARMSHELRTPINAIVGLTALAGNHKNEPEQVEEYLGKIEVSSKVLLNIINDVLDMSAIESNKIKIAEKPFDLREILESISTVYYTQCKQKGIDFQLDMTDVTDEQLIGDGLRLNQILLNLVSNAYKFTPEGGTVRVTAKEAPGSKEKVFFTFMVEDTGEGMSEDMQKRMFRPFEQEGADTAQKHGGSGLGLSIAKNLVDLMGGSISCTSEKGEGTTFVVSVPFAVEGIPVLTVEETPKTSECMGEKYDFTGQKVLLVEDTEINAEIAADLLALVNMETDHAWNGKEAVEMFLAKEPGTYTAILMDVQMPVMNGYEAAQAIRALDREDAGAIPIIAMTANAFSGDISAALNAGMNGHIAKPIDTKLLYQMLKKVTEV